jgi:hypothetical protein
MAKVCPNCEKENPSAAKFCMFCNTQLVVQEALSEEDKLRKQLADAKEQLELVKEKQKLEKELQETKKAQKEEKKQENTTVSAPVIPPIPSKEQIPLSPPVPPIQPKSKTGTIVLISVLAVVALSVFGGLYYYKIYLPEKIDREAARYFSFVPKLNLRSSKDAGADYNKIGSVPYGAELITYEHDSEWSKVKYKEAGGEAKTGYISSSFLLDKADFIRLNSIFGDTESKSCVATSKCRLALLDYFKQHGFIGKISPEVLAETMPSFIANDDNQWQVFCRDFKLKPNNVLYPKIYNKDAKFTDFAVIIKNITTDARRLLLFYFDDDETPHLYYEEPVYNQGYIVSIKTQYDIYSGLTNIVVKYSE